MSNIVGLLGNFLTGAKQSTIFTSDVAATITSSVYIGGTFAILAYIIMAVVKLILIYNEEDSMRLEKYMQTFDIFGGNDIILKIGMIITAMMLLPSVLILVHYAPSIAQEATNVMIGMGIKNSADILNMARKFFK